MTAHTWREKMAYFIMGALGVVAILLLTGAANMSAVGRYQMETIVRSNITHVYVMDTATGRVKWVEKMDTPFEEMKGQ
jgi:hypothetical protein